MVFFKTVWTRASCQTVEPALHNKSA